MGFYRVSFFFFLLLLIDCAALSESSIAVPSHSCTTRMHIPQHISQKNINQGSTKKFKYFSKLIIVRITVGVEL